MLHAQEQFQRSLRTMVRSTVRDLNLHDDLTQELIIHIWKTETARPGQTPSWYRHSCRLCLRNLLRQGRSVDAVKRRHHALAFPDESAERETQLTFRLPVAAEDPSANTCAGDALDALRSRLAFKERAVLELLVRDFTTREIAALLGISLRTVGKCTAQIRTTATELGLGK